MNGVLSAHGARRLLAETMDARGANLEQERLLFNPSPEVDSLVEHLSIALRAGVDAALVAELSTLTRRLIESNQREGRGEMNVAGALDELAARLYRSGTALSGKKAAAILGPALKVIDRPGEHTTGQYIRAVRAVDGVVRGCPTETLLGQWMRKQLRERKFALLEEFVGQSEIAA